VKDKKTGKKVLKDVDVDVETVRKWHKGKGWKDIGYHFLIRKDGTVEEGRPLTQVGAHVEGLNRWAIGIAFSGHGDYSPLTPAQRKAGIDLTWKLMKQFGIPYTRVIGHREVNTLVAKGILPPRYRTTKTCPGKQIAMLSVRLELQSREASGKS
jgi:N-acetyl-anhydromuramyl-L-alanine amidase AmpD